MIDAAHPVLLSASASVPADALRERVVLITGAGDGIGKVAGRTPLSNRKQGALLED